MFVAMSRVGPHSDGGNGDVGGAGASDVTHDVVRRMELVFSPNAPPRSCLFGVSRKGVQGISSGDGAASRLRRGSSSRGDDLPRRVAPRRGSHPEANGAQQGHLRGSADAATASVAADGLSVAGVVVDVGGVVGDLSMPIASSTPTYTHASAAVALATSG